ncbi:MAG: UvrD-helicase domain-containing protein [Oscillospiraceae bacterium]|nr:UvrD-helicase domain-containing protein [Oscillospiraceae bacterium]
MNFQTLRRQILNNEFARMNDRQREAVFATEGPLLILAGAGSGKTTVLINRIANIIRFGNAYHSEEQSSRFDNAYHSEGQPSRFGNTGEPWVTDEDIRRLQAVADGTGQLDEYLTGLLAVDPCPAWRILAITFTNKAAGELKSRLSAMLGPAGDEVMAGTFHSFCARILRREGAALGYSSNFAIYDTDDSRRLMKECMKALEMDEKVLGHRAILNEISRAKDTLCSPEELLAQSGGDSRLKSVARAYALYQQKLLEADAMDFDDLLSRTVELFIENPETLRRYQQRYRYIMVDEYQDTNHVQYRLIKLLAGGWGNLCVVGDDDQSIYKFRGATIENILGFEEEFGGCRLIRLEQNYRSTQNILAAANAVIEKNIHRKGKTLWTENPAGALIEQHVLDNEDEEGRFIAETVLKGVQSGKKFRDFAVLYRANAQSNAIERSLVKSGVPYRIFGGHRFFDTQEIRDATAYLRVIRNPADGVALRRIVNTPRRGIGDTTLDRAAEIADGLGIPLFEVLSGAADYPGISRAADKLKIFVNIINALRQINNEETPLHQLYNTMLEQTGYLEMWRTAGPEEIGRVDNLRELESSIKEYEQNAESGAGQLSGFLEEAALMTDVDNYDPAADAMVLMTMHAAKGLEFPAVILPGFEDGVFPGMQSVFNPDEMEEERRLCYVSLTRAKEKLILTRAASRLLYGSTTRNRQSRFLADIPPHLMEIHDKHVGSGGGYQKTEYEDWKLPAAPKKTAAKPLPKIQTAAKQPAERWQAGDGVYHKTFGNGEIAAAAPMGNDTLLTIRFDGVGEKKIMANFGNLRRRDGSE